jgi:ATP-dependent protease ClpP protease subunit
VSGGWYITNRAAVAGPVTVTIYDSIGADGVRAPSLLAGIGSADEVDVRINSEGGDVFEAITIYNRLADLRRVSVTVDGLAGSAASVVAMAASPGLLAMAPHSRLMIHEAHFYGPSGTAAELSAMAALLDGLSDEIAKVYAHRSGKPAAYWRDRMRAETWFTAAQAVAEGLADYVTDPLGIAGVVRASLREMGWRG